MTHAPLQRKPSGKAPEPKPRSRPPFVRELTSTGTALHSGHDNSFYGASQAGRNLRSEPIKPDGVVSATVSSSDTIAKIKIGSVDDPAERRADSIAERVGVGAQHLHANAYESIADQLGMGSNSFRLHRGPEVDQALDGIRANGAAFRNQIFIHSDLKKAVVRMLASWPMSSRTFSRGTPTTSSEGHQQLRKRSFPRRSNKR